LSTHWVCRFRIVCHSKFLTLGHLGQVRAAASSQGTYIGKNPSRTTKRTGRMTGFHVGLDDQV
jgi:hypothetical protein